MKPTDQKLALPTIQFLLRKDDDDEEEVDSGSTE